MLSSITGLITIAGLTIGSVAAAQQTPATPATTTTITGTSTTTAPVPLQVASPLPTTSTTTTGALVSTDGPGSLDLPAPETTKSPINRPLMVTSVLLLAGTYSASAIDSGASSRDADKNNLYYPVVGPWMDYGKRGGCPETGSCAGETGNKALLILDGVGQGLGAIGMVTSLFIPEKSTKNWFLIGNNSFHAAPSNVGTGYGLGAAGVF